MLLWTVQRLQIEAITPAPAWLEESRPPSLHPQQNRNEVTVCFSNDLHRSAAGLLTGNGLAAWRRSSAFIVSNHESSMSSQFQSLTADYTPQMSARACSQDGSPHPKQPMRTSFLEPTSACQQAVAKTVGVRR